MLIPGKVLLEVFRAVGVPSPLFQQFGVGGRVRPSPLPHHQDMRVRIGRFSSVEAALHGHQVEQAISTPSLSIRFGMPKIGLAEASPRSSTLGPCTQAVYSGVLLECR